jgi:hypothetical protein
MPAVPHDLTRVFLFAFETPERARVFVKRLVLTLRHVAVFVDGEHVRVIDGSDDGQAEEIVRLARTSGAFAPGDEAR